MVETNQPHGWPGIYAPLKGLGTRLKDWLSPASDASSDDRLYRITMELPGVSEDQIALTVDQGLLTVSGEKTETREDKGDTWYFSERQFGAFRRSFRLPGDADADAASAHVKDGVLEITVPRLTPDSGKAKTIPVKRT